ncbi:hypothetical protein SLA2020_059900 [Shorea laevis]
MGRFEPAILGTSWLIVNSRTGFKSVICFLISKGVLRRLVVVIIAPTTEEHDGEANDGKVHGVDFFDFRSSAFFLAPERYKAEMNLGEPIGIPCLSWAEF